MDRQRIAYGSYSDRGSREENQDVCLIAQFKGIWTFAVADGMGGYNFGREAAKIALDAIKSELEVNENSNQEYLYFLLQKKYEQINDYIYNLGISKAVPIGTTVSMLNFLQDKFILSNVGDTRIYRIRNGHIETISKLHNVAAEEYEKGIITLEEYRNHRYKNVLTQCIGIDRNIKPYFAIDSLRRGDFYIICSDGVYNFISEEHLLDQFESCSLVSNEYLNDICRRAAGTALENGSEDNLSIIAVKID